MENIDVIHKAILGAFGLYSRYHLYEINVDKGFIKANYDSKEKDVTCNLLVRRLNEGCYVEARIQDYNILGLFQSHIDIKLEEAYESIRKIADKLNGTEINYPCVKLTRDYDILVCSYIPYLPDNLAISTSLVLDTLTKNSSTLDTVLHYTIEAISKNKDIENNTYNTDVKLVQLVNNPAYGIELTYEQNNEAKSVKIRNEYKEFKDQFNVQFVLTDNIMNVLSISDSVHLDNTMITKISNSSIDINMDKALFVRIDGEEVSELPLTSLALTHTKKNKFVLNTDNIAEHPTVIEITDYYLGMVDLLK